MKFLRRHYFPVFTIVGVLAGCIYIGSWLPLIILSGVFVFFILVAVAIMTATQTKDINIYIREDSKDAKYVHDDVFHRDYDNETIH